MRTAFLVGLLVLFVMSGFSQIEADSIRCELYRSYVDDRMEQWPDLIRKMKELPDSSAAWQKEILLARYGLSGYYLGNKRKEDARNEIDRALNEIEQAQERFPAEASFFCLEASFHSLQIALSVVKAPFYYPRHQAAINRAQNLAETEPLLLFEQANLLFHMPRMFGGSKKGAVKLYQQSRTLLDGECKDRCCWFPLMVDLFLLKAYRELDDEESFQELLDAIRIEHGELHWLSRFLESSVVD